MSRDGRLFFQHGDALTGKPLEKAVRRRETDNPAANDDEVAGFHEVGVSTAG
jgi:hypothetical protein